MGFKEARAWFVDALQSGRYEYEPRSDAEQKNLLASRAVNRDFVVRLLLRCSGWEYSTSRHHTQDADCHIFTPELRGERWYIKAYPRNGQAVFVSVHP